MEKLFIAFAIADSMFTGNQNCTRREIPAKLAKHMIENYDITSGCNPTHKATLDALQERFDITVPVPETAPTLKLADGDMLLVMSVRGLPRLGGDRHEYTPEEIASASFTFALWTTGVKISVV